MGENNNSGLIWGLIIGTIIALAILSRNNQNVLSPPIHIQQPQQIIWKPIDIPRVDDVNPQTIPQHIAQPSVIQIQQDPQLIKALSELQKTNSQLEQTTSKLQELQEAVLKLKQDSIPKIQYSPTQLLDNQPPDSQPSEIAKLPQIAQSMQNQQIYKNNEKWQIVRGKDGRIKSLEIVRDVKKSS